MTQNHFSRVRLIKESSSFHDPKSNVTFNFTLVQASLDLKVRYASQCLSSIWEITQSQEWKNEKIEEIKTILNALIAFLSNTIPQLISED